MQNTISSQYIYQKNMEKNKHCFYLAVFMCIFHCVGKHVQSSSTSFAVCALQQLNSYQPYRRNGLNKTLPY